MATAKPEANTKSADTNAKPAEATNKVRKPPKALLVRLDEQITRAVVSKKITAEDLTKFEVRVGKLKAFLQE